MERQAVTVTGIIKATCEQGLKMRSIFLNSVKIQRIRAGRNLEFNEFWNSNSKILKKLKSLEKLCKKTRSNSKNIGEEFFSNLDRFVG
jgi:hypothetical protein